MNKSKFTFLIDICLFVCIMLIASIGFLINYTLIPGKESVQVYDKNVNLFLWGLDRHEYGTIHLYLGFIFIVLLILHIVLHWKMIVRMYHQLISSPGLRKTSVGALIIVSIFLMIFPFAVNPTIVERGAEKDRYGIRYEQSNPSKQNKISGSNDIGVRGFMTLQQVAKDYNISMNVLIDQLDLPVTDKVADIKLGRLKRRYDFTISELKKIIRDYSNSQ